VALTVVGIAVCAFTSTPAGVENPATAVLQHGYGGLPVDVLDGLPGPLARAVGAYAQAVTAHEVRSYWQAAHDAAIAAYSTAARRTVRCGRGSPSTDPSGIPDCIVQRESGGDWTAHNPRSSASGRYQFLDSTWGGYGGYQSAADAPPEVQAARAAELWAGGAGACHWGAGPCG